MENYSTNTSPNNEEDIIIPKPSNKTPMPASEQPKKDRKLPIIAISLAFLFVILLGVSLYIILSNKDAESQDAEIAPVETTSEDVDVVYSSPDDAEDAGAAFLEHLNEQTSSEDTEEAFSAVIQAANFHIVMEEFDEALTSLESIDESTLNADQVYRLYNTYSRLYEANGNADKYVEYFNKASEARNNLIYEEE